MLPRTFWISNDVIWMRSDIHSFFGLSRKSGGAWCTYTLKAETKKREIAFSINYFMKISTWTRSKHVTNQWLLSVLLSLSSISSTKFSFYSDCFQCIGFSFILLCNFFSSFIHRTSVFVLKKETTFLNWFSATLFFFEKIAYIKYFSLNWMERNPILMFYKARR